MQQYHQYEHTHIERATIGVSSLEQSYDFYHKVLNLTLTNKTSDTYELSNDKEVVLILKKVDGEKENKEGLYHLAFVLQTQKDLGEWYLFIKEKGYEITSARDHFVSKAIYLDDPDGHSVEVTADAPPEYFEDQEKGLNAQSKDLDLDELTKGLTAPVDLTIHPAIGHLNFQTKDIEQLHNFYVLLDFKTRHKKEDAIFVGFEDYHHHLVINTWYQGEIAPYKENDLNIHSFSICYDKEDMLTEVKSTLKEHDYNIHKDEEKPYVVDPLGIKIYLSSK